MVPGARLAFCAFLVAATTLNAAPQVEIKGKSQLSLTKVKSREDGVEVTGQLVDKLTNEGLPGQNVRITIGGTVESAMTQPDGTFRVVVPVDPGPNFKVEIRTALAPFLSGKLYDDGVIDPRDTRTVLGVCLSAVHSGSIKGADGFGVFRM